MIAPAYDSDEQPLVTPLIETPYVRKPEEIDRFLVRVWPDGTIYFKGPRERVDEFLTLCSEAGISIDVDHVSLCG